MSTQYPGGIVRAVPITPTGPYQNGTAPGIWTLDQVAYWVKQSLWPTAGNTNPDAFIENLFSTYLYTGNGSTQTITNGIDLAGKGGMIWFKPRNTANNHNLIDSARGLNKFLITNSTAANGTTGAGYGVSSFNSTGFSLDPPWTSSTNTTDTTYASWTFREQPKFFDVVTWTGDGTGNRTILHSLGSTPGFIQTKRTDAIENWWNFHRSVTSPNANWWRNYGTLETTNAFSDWGDNSGLYQSPDSTSLYIGSYYNASGKTYVAYLFAHDAGGFGLTGNENVVSCGSYTGNGSATGPVVTLGYEPQWLMIKRSSAAGDWVMLDVMRGFSDSSDNELYANLSLAEGSGLNLATPLATGFQLQSSTGNLNASGQTYIYIAIRRGPMAVPTLGTTVFAPVVQTPSGVTTVTTGFPSDLSIFAERVKTAIGGNIFFDRLRGTFKTYSVWLYSQSTSQETIQASNGMGFDSNTTIVDNISAPVWGVNSSSIYWNFKRAPSVFDIVCYTGTGGASQTFAHNLGVAPELVIVKCRSDAAAWESLGTALNSSQRQIYLNRTQAGVAVASGHLGWNGTDGAYKAPTNTLVYFGGDSDVGGAGLPYVAYLFATCPGVSKVGSYTGTGTTQAINCGFTAGARFVMIKRTDSTGDWYVWDSARGIVAGNDPYLSMNTTASEVTSTDYIDTSAAGFEISSTAPAAINASGGSFIFLAIS